MAGFIISNQSYEDTAESVALLGRLIDAGLLGDKVVNIEKQACCALL